MVVRYKDDPALKKKVVVTAEGTTEYVKNCRKIDEKYYAIGTECIQIGGKWTALSDPSVHIDHETKEYFSDKARGRRVYGVVDVVDHKPVYGYFTPNLAKNVKYIDNAQHSMVVGLSDDVFRKSPKFIESKSEGVWYSYLNAIPASDLKKHNSIFNAYDWTVKRYNLEENVHEYAQKTVSYNNYAHPIDDWCERYGKFLRYSFGSEFEVQQGFVTDYMQYRHGIVICRDGSINGGMEAVTIPMSGPKGLSSLYHLCNYMKDRVVLDIHCSTHLHLGGFPAERNKIVALYLLCYRMQNDVFDMLPPYKRHWEGYKRKNYCKELDSLGIVHPLTSDKPTFDKWIHRAYSQIFNFVSDFKQEVHQYHVGDRHPSGHKWDIESRKSWINFVNVFYSRRGTLEFRPLQATFNPVKIINWLFICNAILMYADIHTNDLLTSSKPVSLNEVLNVYANLDIKDRDGEFLSQYLIEYCASRSNEFLECFKKKEFACQWDLDGDKSYDFKLGNKNLFNS